MAEDHAAGSDNIDLRDHDPCRDLLERLRIPFISGLSILCAVGAKNIGALLLILIRSLSNAQQLQAAFRRMPSSSHRNELVHPAKLGNGLSHRWTNLRGITPVSLGRT